MKMVTAIAAGFYGKHRSRGEAFAVPDDFKASWATDEAELPPAADAEPGLLDKTIDEIVAQISTLSDTELVALKDAETSGKTRVGLIAKLDDETANRATAKLNERKTPEELADEALEKLTTHAEIDALAQAEGVTFSDEDKTVVAKKTAIRAAREEAALLS